MSDVLFLLCKRCEIVSDILSEQVCDMKEAPPHLHPQYHHDHQSPATSCLIAGVKSR